MSTQTRTVTGQRISEKGSRRSLPIAKGIKISVMLLLMLIAILPFYFMVLSSFKNPANWAISPPRLFTTDLSLANWKDLFETSIAPFQVGFLNSVKITVLNVAGTVISSSLAGFALARMNFPGKRFIFIFLISSFAIPGIVLALPSFVMWFKLGFYNTQVPLWLPAWLGNTFDMFLLLQFFRSLPRELEEAALIDGANWLQVYLKIALPLMRPILITIALFATIGSWDNLMGPLIYINDMSKQTVTFMVALFSTEFGTQQLFFEQMAASTISVVPIAIIYVFSQRYFMQAVTTETIKG